MSQSTDWTPQSAVRARLRWTDTVGAEQVRSITTTISIGRGTSNAISLHNDSEASRRHASLAPGSAGDFMLTDLGSSNGTQVNGQRLPPHLPQLLQTGDQITIGRTTFTFELVEAPRAVPLPPSIVPELGNTTVNLIPAAIGWLSLPDGSRRVLGAENRIGRAASNDIVIEDADRQVSRKHALIRRIDDQFVISDLGAANGVWVNGERIDTPRHLTDGDAIELGSVKLEFALAPLGGGDSLILSSVAVEAPRASDTALLNLFGGTSAQVGELREATILFSDMHGYTRLSEKLNNPEQTAFIVNKIFDRLVAEIDRYGGTVVKFAGDNVMAIFGAPIAHEDDPLRAVKAALSMASSLERENVRLKRELGVVLQMRTGIDTGKIFYGEVGGGSFRRADVIGDTVNRAARLETASRVGYVTVGEPTYVRAKEAFVFTRLEPKQLKNIAEPVECFEVVRERRPDEMNDLVSDTDYLIGRETELAQLQATMAEVRNGQGRLLGIVGDAGIGKSQLLANFRRSPDGASSAWIVVRNLSFETSASYRLFNNVILALLGLAGEESLDRDKLHVALSVTIPQVTPGALTEYLALLGEALGVRVGKTALQGLEPQLKRKLLVDLMRELVTTKIYPQGRDQPGRPLTIVLEEMQWADTASIDVLAELVDAVPSLPLLLLPTYRSEWQHSWSNRSFYRQITLRELTPEQSRRFLQSVLLEAVLPEAVADQIIAQCGNNPQLLEETASALQERGVLAVRGSEWALVTDLSLINMPSGLRGLLMARIDRLGEYDRTILQKAAVIGRIFTYRLLAMLVGGSDQLDESLLRLKEGQFIVENPLAAEAEYHFKQPSIQEIAYTTILASERRGLHGQVGEALEAIAGNRIDDLLETLAYHFSHSSSRRKAIEYLLRSGEKARRLYANTTAIAQFEAALDKLRALSTRELAQDSALALHVYAMAGEAYLTTADFVRAQERYEAGINLPGTTAEDRASLWEALGRLWERRGEARKALGSYEQAIVLLENPSLAQRVALHAALSRAHAQLGQYDRAAELATGVLAALPPISIDADPQISRAQADAHHVLGMTDYANGQINEAIEHHVYALTLRQQLGDTAGMQESYHEIGSLYWSRGQLDRAFEHLVGVTTILRLSVGDSGVSRRVTPAPTGGTATPLPPLLDSASELAPVERYYRSGLAAAQQIEDHWSIATIAYRVGSLLCRQGERDRANGYLRKALTEADRIGVRDVAAASGILLGQNQVLLGEPNGLQQIERGVALAEAIESALTLTEGQIRLAEAKLLLGDVAGAAQEGQTAFLLATRLGHQYPLGLVNRVLGAIATAQQEWALADRHFRLALGALNAVDAQHEVGRALTQYALMWRSWSMAGHGVLPEGATQMLQQAAQIFSRLDMRADLQVARAALLQ